MAAIGFVLLAVSVLAAWVDGGDYEGEPVLPDWVKGLLFTSGFALVLISLATWLWKVLP